jgi:amphi-Trp domain-containing protein
MSHDEENGRIKFKNQMQKEEAAVYFEALVDGLRKGSLQLQHVGEKLVLEPQGEIKVEIKASRKDSKQKVSFEMSWRTLHEEGTITAGSEGAESGESGDEQQSGEGAVSETNGAAAESSVD